MFTIAMSSQITLLTKNLGAPLAFELAVSVVFRALVPVKAVLGLESAFANRALEYLLALERLLVTTPIACL